MKRFKTKAPGILSSAELKTSYGKFLYWLFFALLLIVCAVSLIPAIWTVVSAFKPTQEIYSSEVTFFPKEMSFEIFKTRLIESWSTLQLQNAVINTLVLSIGELFMTLAFDGLGGYVLSKLKPKGIKFIFALVVWTMMMPSQIRMVPNYISWLHFPFAYDIGGVSIMNTYWPMWISAAANTFNVVLFKNSFDMLSDSYVEAAKLDGCTDIGILLRIMFPLSMPIVIYVSIMTLSGSWSNFFTPMLVLNPEKYTVPVRVLKLKSSTSVQLNTYFMCMVFASVPPFIIFVLFQKYIMGGVNIGGVKG
ncbi:MAG: carbohydrate ABC transporter permease [Clostridia bacterium]|nr:carbohydrate ABC transporter permease [Clostridia bacterium]